MKSDTGFHLGDQGLLFCELALSVGAFSALLMALFSSQILGWTGVAPDLVTALTWPVGGTFAFMTVWLGFEVYHVALTRRTRRALARLEDGVDPSVAADFNSGEWGLFAYQIVLGVVVIGGFILMMFVPGILEQSGVNSRSSAAITVLVWLIYVGPMALSAFRFHHVGVTRHTRRRLAEMTATSAQ